MRLLTKKEYLQQTGIEERTFYRMKKRDEIEIMHTLNGEFIIVKDAVREMSEDSKIELVEKLKPVWNADIKQCSIYNAQCAEDMKKKRTATIKRIRYEVEHYENLFGMKIKGYDVRSLQRKIASGRTERQTRCDKFKIRNRVLSNEEVFEKCMGLVSEYYLRDALGSLSLAIDRTIQFAKENEDYWEIAAVNIHTLRRHIGRVFKMSGMRTMHEYMNHYNKWNSHRAYVKGAFTNDLDFMDVYSLDDHKFDISGVKVFNEDSGEFENKMLYSWVMIEIKTMMPVCWMFKAEPFKEDDIIRMIMVGFKKHGLPKKKVICDQGLAASERVRDFFIKLGVPFEPQPPYTPTAKAPNERIFKIIKEECDIYNPNFVGSNHPVEGKHTGLKLSPEEITELASEAIKRLDKFMIGDFMTRPRKREINGIEHLLDNTGRVNIQDLVNHYYKSFEKIEVSGSKLRFAYMKNAVVKNLVDYSVTFLKQLYLPDPSDEMNLKLNDPSFKFLVAYDPTDLNEIDLYSLQDILDTDTGELIAKGQKICTMKSITPLEAGEKRTRVKLHMTRVRKGMNELAKAIRESKSDEGVLVNKAIDDTGNVINVAKHDEKLISNIIKNSIPLQQINDLIALGGNEEKINYEKALSEESYNSLDEL